MDQLKKRIAGLEKELANAKAQIEKLQVHARLCNMLKSWRILQ